MNRLIRRALLAGVVLAAVAPGVAQAATTVPGQTGSRTDADNNGFPDAGVQVVGNYRATSTFGDTVCTVRVNYKGDFGNDAYLNSGEIQNHWICDGPDGHQTYNYVIVSNTDPRYSGDPDWAIWVTWEYHVLTQGGQGNEPFGGNGNLVRPYKG